MTLTRRTEIPADESFLRQLILGTIGEQLGAAAWPEPMRSQLLELQYKTRRQATRPEPPQRSSEVIVADGQDAGWLVVADVEDHIRLVEIMVASEFRSHGIGAEIIRQVIAAAGAAGKPVRLRVDVTNTRAAELYRRLGFRSIDGDQVQQLMEWCAGS